MNLNVPIARTYFVGSSSCSPQAHTYGSLVTCTFAHKMVGSDRESCITRINHHCRLIWQGKSNRGESSIRALQDTGHGFQYAFPTNVGVVDLNRVSIGSLKTQVTHHSAIRKTLCKRENLPNIVERQPCFGICFENYPEAARVSSTEDIVDRESHGGISTSRKVYALLPPPLQLQQRIRLPKVTIKLLLPEVSLLPPDDEFVEHFCKRQSDDTTTLGGMIA